MKQFVDIKTVYNDFSERTVENLSSIYANYEYLLGCIGELVDRNIPYCEIENKKILIKPNLVLHNTKDSDAFCLRTNENFILAVVECILKCYPASIIVGDAPIQGCEWEKMIDLSFYNRLFKLSKEYSTPIIFKDFRRTISSFKTNKIATNQRPIEEYVIFDIGNESYLEPITKNKNKFRVTNYNPDVLSQTHSKGIHKYCIIKDMFECDTVIVLPKIKTHQKSGITNALKILVGLNGDKGYLPHHRKGTPETNGDCYPKGNLFNKLAEDTLDIANRFLGKELYKPFMYTSRALWKFSGINKKYNMGASWYGNDTTWRMVMDINIIAEYGTIDGKIANSPQRVIYSICDGIIAGQGDGPLLPEPHALGIIAMSNNSYIEDIIVTILMGLDPGYIPLIVSAKCHVQNTDYQLLLNNKPICIDDLEPYISVAKMPPGWVDYKSHQREKE